MNSTLEEFLADNEKEKDYETINLIENIKQKERKNLLKKMAMQKSKKRPTKFGLCKVCQDVASGIHYGIPACDGCKGFFVRSLTKYKTYICFNDKKCGIGAERRKSCKSCRFKLCLQAGMSVESMKLSRKTVSQKKMKLKDNADTGLNEDTFDSRSNDTFTSKELVRFNKSNKSNNEGTSSDFNYDLNFNILNSIDSIIESKCGLRGEKSSNAGFFNRNHANGVSNNKNCIDRLKKAFSTPNILARTSFSEKYLNTDSEGDLIIFSILKDRVYQLHNMYLRIDDKLLENARLQSDNLEISRSTFLGNDSTIEEVWDAQIKSLSNFAKILCTYASQLPGFNKICPHDFPLTINESVFCLYGIHNSEFFINDECFIVTNNIQFSRKWLSQYLNEICLKNILNFFKNFNKFKLTKKEISLLMPFVITSVNVSQLTDPATLNSLNQYYKKILLYEFGINRRNDETIKRILQALDYFARLTQNTELNIYMNHINSQD